MNICLTPELPKGSRDPRCPKDISNYYSLGPGGHVCMDICTYLVSLEALFLNFGTQAGTSMRNKTQKKKNIPNIHAYIHNCILV